MGIMGNIGQGHSSSRRIRAASSRNMAIWQSVIQFVQPRPNLRSIRLVSLKGIFVSGGSKVLKFGYFAKWMAHRYELVVYVPKGNFLSLTGKIILLDGVGRLLRNLLFLIPFFIPLDVITSTQFLGTNSLFFFTFGIHIALHCLFSPISTLLRCIFFPQITGNLKHWAT